MDSFIFYLLKSGIWIAVFGLIYRFFFQQETFFKFNRYYLLAGLPASFALAACRYKYSVCIDLQMEEIEGNSVEQTASFDVSSDWEIFVFALYLAGVLVVLTYQLAGLYKIHRLRRKSSRIVQTNFTIIDTPEIQSSFSFFGSVFINSASRFSETENRLILEHETAHIQQKHWIDLSVLQIAVILQWFNPFIWLYQRSVKQNHEYLADRATINKENQVAVYQAVLINCALQAPIFAFANSFAYSGRFKRINMMKKNPSKPAKKLAVLLLLPAFALFLWLFAQPKYAFAIAIQSQAALSTPDSITIIARGNSEKKRELTIFNSVLKINQNPQDADVSFETQIRSRTISGDSVFYEIRITKKEIKEELKKKK
jgi:hypothetical protein